MKPKILCLVLGCLILFVSSGAEFNNAKAAAVIKEVSELTEQKEKQKNAMKWITVITTCIVDYVTDHGVAPKQEGIYDENSEFYKAVVPFYVRELPIKDPWGNNYQVYTGKACDGKYGISYSREDDCVVVSYGRDGKKEDWKFDPGNPEAGLIEMKTEDDFNMDIIMWNGSWIRAPRTSRY